MSATGGLEMLEFKGRAVQQGLHKTFRELCEAAGLGHQLKEVVNGYMESSPSGGIHFLYRTPNPKGNTELARRPATDKELAEVPADKIKVLIETRGEGGYTIVAPSGGRVHESGKSYELLLGGFDQIATITDNTRKALWQIAQTLDQKEPALTPDLVRVKRDRVGLRPGPCSDRTGTPGWRRLRRAFPRRIPPLLRDGVDFCYLDLNG